MFNLTTNTKTINVPAIDKKEAFYAAITRFEQYMSVPNEDIKDELKEIYQEGDAWRVLNAGKAYWQRHMQATIDRGCYEGKLSFVLGSAMARYRTFEKRFALMATVLKSRHPVPAFYTARVAPTKAAIELVMPSNTMDPADYWEAQEEGYEPESRVVTIDAQMPSQEHNMLSIEEVVLWVAEQEEFAGLSYVSACAMRHIWRTKAEDIGKELKTAITAEQWEMLEREPNMEEMKDKHLVRLEILKGTRVGAHPLAVLGAAAWAKKTIARDLYRSMVFGNRAINYVQGLVDQAVTIADSDRSEFFQDPNGSMYEDDGYHGNYDQYVNWADVDKLHLGGLETEMPLRAWGEQLKTAKLRKLNDVMDSLRTTLATVTSAGIIACETLDAEFKELTDEMSWPCLPLIWMVHEDGSATHVFDPDQAAAEWAEAEVEFKARTIEARIDALEI